MSFSRTGPLTLRMMDREASSMNSTRTWVTPPREPGYRRLSISVHLQFPSPIPHFARFIHLSILLHCSRAGAKGGLTGATENLDDLDELDGSLGGLHFDGLLNL
jgi:hypothetical protein